MTGSDLLVDAFSRVQEVVHHVVDGLGDDDLAWRADADANSIAWLVWHLTRVQDDHVAHVAGAGQVWTSDGWAQRFNLPFETGTIGYGHSSQDVAAVRVTGDLLTAYYDAVHANTVDYLSSLKDDDFDRVVDTNWDPPVTLGVRLVSVLDDDTQHAGQAAFVRGLLERRG